MDVDMAVRVSGRTAAMRHLGFYYYHRQCYTGLKQRHKIGFQVDELPSNEVPGSATCCECERLISETPECYTRSNT
jgi:hypothetical protein